MGDVVVVVSLLQSIRLKDSHWRGQEVGRGTNSAGRKSRMQEPVTAIEAATQSIPRMHTAAFFLFQTP